MIDINVLTALLMSQADPDKQNNTGQTALMLAVIKDSVDAVNLLANFKADPTLQDSEGNTALMLAAQAGNLAIVQAILLAAQGKLPAANVKKMVNVANKAGQTALTLAGENPEIAAALRAVGAKDASIADSDTVKSGEDPVKKSLIFSRHLQPSPQVQAAIEPADAIGLTHKNGPSIAPPAA